MNNEDREMQHLDRLVEKTQREALGMSEDQKTREIDKLVARAQNNLAEETMENPVKNFYTVKPQELEPGDVLLCVVKLVVMEDETPGGRKIYRLYRCAYPADTNCMYEEDVPQGSRIFPEDEAFGVELFPVAGYAGMEIE